MPMATSSSLAAATATAATAASSSASTLNGGGGSSGVGGSTPLIGTSAAQFREIHKNTWLKRLTAEGKKITVGPKKSERSWVVFCVHDDTDALLEGYAEPRQAASHIPEWTISMQDTLHISHALIPNSHEFEFVVTLTNEVIRFHAMSWEIMQEWVETLRSKLREMKILSPRENLYTKLPEIRAPLLPTRDPTSPLPAPPPVPAAIVPGVERVVPPSLAVQQDSSIQETTTRLERNTSSSVATSTTSAITQSSVTTASAITGTMTTTSQNSNCNTVENAYITTTIANRVNAAATLSTAVVSTSLPALTSMSNTLTQNLLNMLSDPISAYSEQINDVSFMDGTSSSIGDANDILDFDDEFLSPILRKSVREQDNTKSKTNADNSVRFDVGQRASADQVKNWETFVEADYSSTHTRPQTSRSLSAGAADSSRKSITKSSIPNNCSTKRSNDNIMALEISTDTQSQHWQNLQIDTTTTEQLDVDKMNITIIEVSTNDSNEQKQNETKRANNTSKASPSPSSSSKRVTGDIFKFPETTTQHEYKSNVQIIPSTKTNSSTIQVLGNKINNSKSAAEITNKTTSTTTMAATATQYATPVKKNIQNVVASLLAPTTTNSAPAPTAATKITTTGTLLSNTDELQITTVHVTGNSNTTATATNAASTTTTTTNVDNVVANSVSLYGTCYTTMSSSLNSNILRPTNANTNANGINDANAGVSDTGGVSGTPKMMKKIILSANSSGITNITVNNSNTSAACDTTTMKHNVGSVHYEKVFLSTSVPPPSSNVGTINALMNAARSNSPTLTPNRRAEIATTSSNKSITASTSKPSSPIPQLDAQKQSKQSTVVARTVSPSTGGIVNDDMPLPPLKSRHKLMQSPLMSRAHRPNASPVPDRRRLTTTTTTTTTITTNQAITQVGTSSPPPSVSTSSSTKTAATTVAFSSTPFPHLPPSRAHLLTRGLTEAVITTRPSRRDFHLVKPNASKNKLSTEASKNSTATVTSNNNGNNIPTATNASSSSSAYHPSQSSSRNRNCDLLEQRRRSSSTSDARSGATRGANNNELPGGRNVALRFQQPPQSFRNMENGLSNGGGGGGSSGTALSTSMPLSSGGSGGANNASANMRMTLREHQVMQLRREIMHPGGVRLQLRRKDCVGSIAWVDAFGAVWVAGWKQKEHPVLYNALHIGDQLLSIAGTAVATASEANKIIRNTNTLFVEVLVRRIPFGRGYAIRREREGQCLGLIRDGNTATIVDVVPNSLAARHGLPPKAQSCDGTTLTFWVLTEINGRPLNLYFKDNEIRDRLNSVGRDISILVQPSDLITKLKKQLKSLRGYKDYLVQ